MQTCRSRSICAAQPHKSQLADLEHQCWFTNTIQYCLRPDDLRTILANNVFKRNRILLSVVGVVEWLAAWSIDPPRGQ